jgi:GNAT superfamily N-acetyltransferase
MTIAPPADEALVIAPLADHAAHLPLLAAWNLQSWGAATGRSYDGYVARLTAYLSRGPLPMALIALWDGRPAGTACVNLDDMSTRPGLSPWLANLYVDPAFRRRGIGGALVRAAEDAARAAGHARLHLYTPNQERLYAALGWRVVERDVYDGEDVAVMLRDL